jgi:hypothetical protein
MSKLSQEDEAHIREGIRTSVRSGYDDAGMIEKSWVEVATESEPPLSERDAQEYVRTVLIEEIKALQKDQKDWPAATDYERLRAAFNSLEASGIVARENFTCCQTCGNAEIGAEAEVFKASGQVARGYVFFHQQDTESAVSGGGLHFTYGAFQKPYDQNALQVGHALVDALKAAGLAPEWNGKLSKRIFVPVNWQRRWTGEVPKPVKGWMF